MVYDISIDEIFDNIKLNKEGQYVISNCELCDLVDQYVVNEDCNDIKKCVSNFCVFKAIELYEDTYGDFVINLEDKYQMYITLAHVIIMDIIFNGKMTEDRDGDDTDDDTDDEEEKTNA